MFRRTRVEIDFKYFNRCYNFYINSYYKFTADIYYDRYFCCRLSPREHCILPVDMFSITSVEINFEYFNRGCNVYINSYYKFTADIYHDRYIFVVCHPERCSDFCYYYFLQNICNIVKNNYRSEHRIQNSLTHVP